MWTKRFALLSHRFISQSDFFYFLGGVAGAILEACDEKFRKAGLNHVRKRGEVSVGDVHIQK